MQNRRGFATLRSLADLSGLRTQGQTEMVGAVTDDVAIRLPTDTSFFQIQSGNSCGSQTENLPMEVKRIARWQKSKHGMDIIDHLAPGRCSFVALVQHEDACFRGLGGPCWRMDMA